MYKSIICFLIIFSFLGFNAASANYYRTLKKERGFPNGCEPMGYHFDLYNVIFEPTVKRYSQTIYLIQNKSDRTVHLLQAHNGNDTYVAYINGHVRPHSWSVLSVSEHKIKYICTNYEKRHHDHQIINCQNVLRICEFPHTRFGTNHRGTYWLVENRSRDSAVRATRYHGILLIDHKRKENHR